MIGSASRPLVIGTRASTLALTQTRGVAADLQRRGLNVEVKTFTTEGDVNRASLSQLGGVGVFAAALRVALLEGDCDLAVHSLKDLPTVPVPGLTVAATPTRVNPADVLVARNSLTFSALPAGSRIGTGSPRRARQIAVARPDLELVDIRGNVPTRVGRVKGLAALAQTAGLGPGRGAEDLDGVVLARAGLQRLGLEGAITDSLDDVIIPAAGQGALALETREDLLTSEEGRNVAQILKIVDDEPTHLEVGAERALLRYLEAGCAAPLGVRGVLTWDQHTESPSGRLELTARVIGNHGELVEVNGETTVLLGVDTAERDFAMAAAQQLGVDLAGELLEAGGGEVANLRAEKPQTSGEFEPHTIEKEKELWGD